MKDLPNVIEIAIGMKVMVTSNIEADLDITNGALGEIVEPPSLPDRKFTQRTIRRCQFAMTGAYLFTDYRSQGQTIPYILVDIAAPPTGSLSLFNLYVVALSRSSDRETIHLLRDFDDELFMKSHYPMLLAEDGLKALNEQTERWWDEMQSCGQSREQMVEEQLQAEESAS
ncbi:hypothetical protein C8R44DRAFT_742034 [Mycena epipterygia]|nr:hypothetical protein C8R44DRAFT_742034 [Mycena epipterygia]